MGGKRQKGFTIVELLIVIVVIAILAAITVVAYNGIRQRAESSARLSEMSQLQRKIQVDVLQDSGASISIKAPLVRATGAGTGAFSAPLQSAQEVTLYGVFDTTGNAAGSNWSTIIALVPSDTNNALRLRTGANTEDSARAYYATSAVTNRDITRSGIMSTTGRHIGWVTANATTITSAFDNYAEGSQSLAAHTGWNFDTIQLYSQSSYSAVAALVFPEYHDAATRTQIIRWLNKQYNVGL